MTRCLIRNTLCIAASMGALQAGTAFSPRPPGRSCGGHPPSSSQRPPDTNTAADGNLRPLRAGENHRSGQRSLSYPDRSGGGGVTNGEKRSGAGPCPTDAEVERKIFNPMTKRYIRQTSGSGNRKKRSRWQRFMYEEGGYIAHRGTLVPIDLELLRGRNPEKERAVDLEGSDSDSAYRSTNRLIIDQEDGNWNDPDDTNGWNRISPSLTMVDRIDTPEQGLTISQQEPLLLPAIDQLLFVHKPAKLLTLPGIGTEKSDCLASRVNQWLHASQEGKDSMATATASIKRAGSDGTATKKKKRTNKKKKKSPFEPRPCHRLDFDTSGVMVVALSPTAHRATSMLFERRFVRKTYVALVAGHLEHDSGTINLPIGKVWNEEGGFHKFACLVPPPPRAGGRSGDNRDAAANGTHVRTEESDFADGSLRGAETGYSVSQRFTLPLPDGGRDAAYTRVILTPRTGRGHQLRLHMEAIGHSILGDRLHAPGHVAECTPCLCLHAESIQMPGNVYSQDDAVQLCQVMVQQTAPF